MNCENGQTIHRRRAVARGLLFCVAALGLALLHTGCARSKSTAATSISPTIHQSASPAIALAAAQLSAPPAPVEIRPLVLSWNVNDNTHSTVTQIFTSPDLLRPLTQWELVTESRDGAIHIWPTNTTAFYLARNRNGTNLSIWNQP